MLTLSISWSPTLRPRQKNSTRREKTDTGLCASAGNSFNWSFLTESFFRCTGFLMTAISLPPLRVSLTSCLSLNNSAEHHSAYPRPHRSALIILIPSNNRHRRGKTDASDATPRTKPTKRQPSPGGFCKRLCHWVGALKIRSTPL